jgi:signal transduction histidine kinase/ligand-binding sensor domain-containing protein/DNA-binding NarL/FixJ family response regulator
VNCACDLEFMENIKKYLYPLFFFCCLSCQQPPPPIEEDAPKYVEQDLLLFDRHGDTIVTGQPFTPIWDTILSSSLKPPDVYPGYMKKHTLGEHQKFELQETRTISFPKQVSQQFPSPDVYPLDSFALEILGPEVLPMQPFSILNTANSTLQNLNVEQGLPTPFVNSIAQDAQGFFWIISQEDQLLRYDGKNCWQYQFILNGNQLIGFSAVNIDQEGNIWLISHAHEEKLLIKFNGAEAFAFDIKIKVRDETSFVHFSSDGALWLPGKHGLLLIKEGQIYRYSKKQGFTTLIRQVEHDSEGQIWVASDSMLSCINPKGIRHLSLPEIYVRPLARDAIIASKGKKTIWLNFYNELARIDDDKLTVYTAPILKQEGIYSFLSSARGELILGHEDRGISFIKGHNLIFHPFGPGIEANHLAIEIQDKDNRLWMSSAGYGLYKYDPFAFKHFQFADIWRSRMASAITKTPDGGMWIGPHGGGYPIRWDGDSYAEIMPQQNHLLFGNKATRAMLWDKKNHLWLGRGDGLIKWDGQQLIDYTQTKGLAQKQVFALLEGQMGEIWIGQLDGLSRFNGATYVSLALKTASESSPHVRALIRDRAENIWIAYQGAGLAKYDGRQLTVYTMKEGLSSNQVVSLLEDSKGHIWIGTIDGGINRFDGQAFKVINKEDGLSSNSIWTINEDQRGYLWVGAGFCLNVLRPEKTQRSNEASIALREKPAYQIASYCKLDGFTGVEFFANASQVDQEGNLWWGSNRGLTTVDGSIDPFPGPPVVKLTGLEIEQIKISFKGLQDSIRAGNSYWVGESNPVDFSKLRFSRLEPFQLYPKELVLPHNMNSLSFHFAGLHSLRPDQIHFRHKMEGYDDKWSLPTPVSKTTYRNLPPGKYAFLVQASGNDGLWSDPIRYTFRVSYPWWRQIWAIFLWCGLVGLILYGLYRLLLNRQLKQKEMQKIVEIEALKSRLYTNITHEFRTPLTVIMGLTAQLKEAQKKNQFENGLNLIQRNSERLLSLINQLLDLSKLESNELKLNSTQGDIVTFLQYVTESFYSLAHDNDIRLTFYSEPNELFMDFDEEKIQQIAYNLLSNAIKFTAAKGKVILHLLETSDKGKRLLELRVKDTGKGIATDQLPHIFDRFYQADGSSTRKWEGTGIGLALTKELVTLMGGTIKAESIEGKGTTFILHLPISQNASERTEKQQLDNKFLATSPLLVPLSENPTAPEDAPLLLIVEDNPDVTEYIQTILSSYYQVITASDGQEGIEQALEKIPDIIISDVMMPEKDGFEVCEALRSDERTSHIPIILLTARAATDDRIQGLKYGADAYLTKPFHKEELLVRLEHLVLTRQKLQEHYTKFGKVMEPANEQSKSHALFLQKLQDVILSQLDNPGFGVPELAKAVHMGQMQVYRKLKALTSKTPSQFIRSVRLQKGKELLLTTDMNVSEVAYSVGFADPNYFSRTFQQEFNTSPRDIRK